MGFAYNGGTRGSGGGDDWAELEVICGGERSGMGEKGVVNTD
ncbi:hypothetical protein [Poriferisphaera sp. WC338]